MSKVVVSEIDIFGVRCFSFYGEVREVMIFLSIKAVSLLV